MWWQREGDQSRQRRGTAVQAETGRTDRIPIAPLTPESTGSRGGGSFIVDAMGHVLAFDRAMEKLTGWAAFEVVGQHKDLGLYEKPDGEGVRRFEARPLYAGALPRAGRTTSATLQLFRKDGVQLEVQALVSPLGSKGQRYCVEVQRVLARLGDAPDRRGSEGVDRLTQLPGRELFAKRLRDAFSAAQRNGQPLAALFISVDRMSDLTDRCGREQTDEILRRVAGILRASLRQGDFIARLREDRFSILLDGTGRGDARHIGGRIRQTIDRFAFARPGGSGELKVTVSIGVACYPADGETPSELARRAEEALEEAHRLGRNRVWCYVRRPRVPVQTPIYFDGPEGHLLGQSRDLSNSGVFVETHELLPIGMRVGIAFRLPGTAETMRMVGRVARQTPPGQGEVSSTPGLGIEFERYNASDRRRIESYIHKVRGGRPETVEPS